MGVSQQPEEVPGVQVQIGHSVETGPDGRPWVKLQVGLGLAVFAMLVPEQTARELATILSNALVEAADAARRSRIGLIVPGNGSASMTAEQVAALRSPGG